MQHGNHIQPSKGTSHFAAQNAVLRDLMAEMYPVIKMVLPGCNNPNCPCGGEGQPKAVETPDPLFN